MYQIGFSKQAKHFNSGIQQSLTGVTKVLEYELSIGCRREEGEKEKAETNEA